MIVLEGGSPNISLNSLLPFSFCVVSGYLVSVDSYMNLQVNKQYLLLITASQYINASVFLWTFKQIMFLCYQFTVQHLFFAWYILDFQVSIKIQVQVDLQISSWHDFWTIIKDLSPFPSKMIILHQLKVLTWPVHWLVNKGRNKSISWACGMILNKN